SSHDKPQKAIDEDESEVEVNRLFQSGAALVSVDDKRRSVCSLRQLQRGQRRLETVGQLVDIFGVEGADDYSGQDNCQGEPKQSRLCRDHDRASAPIVAGLGGSSNCLQPSGSRSPPMKIFTFSRAVLSASSCTLHRSVPTLQ